MDANGKIFTTKSTLMWVIDGVEHYWQTGFGRSMLGTEIKFTDKLFCKGSGYFNGYDFVNYYYVPPVDKITDHLV